jgi:hypothetical protein
VLPLEQATYEINFVSHLPDRDSFELLSVASPKHNIESGKTGQI